MIVLVEYGIGHQHGVRARSAATRAPANRLMEYAARGRLPADELAARRGPARTCPRDRGQLAVAAMEYMFYLARPRFNRYLCWERRPAVSGRSHDVHEREAARGTCPADRATCGRCARPPAWSSFAACSNHACALASHSSTSARSAGPSSTGTYESRRSARRSAPPRPSHRRPARAAAPAQTSRGCRRACRAAYCAAPNGVVIVSGSRATAGRRSGGGAARAPPAASASPTPAAAAARRARTASAARRVGAAQPQ